MKPEHDPLNQLLDRWKVDTPETQLSSKVWREIERRGLEARTTGLLGSLENLFARPSFSIGLVLGCVLLGLFLAEIRVAKIQSDRSTVLAQSYLQLINPLLEEDQAER